MSEMNYLQSALCANVRSASCVVMLFALCAMPAQGAEDPERWPGFLGAGHTPLEGQTLPLSWSPTENIAWRTTVAGHGQSSPVIWGDLVFITSTEGPKKETNHLTALNMASGEVAWTKALPSTNPVENSVYVSRAAPTPAVNSDHVFVFFESGDVAAFTHAGELRWEKSLAKQIEPPQNRFGIAASPVLYGKSVILLVDDPGPAYLIALDQSTGETLWKTDRTSRTCWSSPVLQQLAGRDQLVTSSAGSVDGYDPTSGQLLWTYTAVGGNTVATPLSAGENRFLVGASAGREGENTEMAKESNLVLEIQAAADGTYVPQVIWKTPDAQSSFGSPVAHGGYAYWINRAGVLYCFNIETGEKLYQERLEQSAWATPLGLADRLYIFGKDGKTFVVKVGPTYELLATNELFNAETIVPDNSLPTSGDKSDQGGRFSGPIQYGSAAVNGSLIIRTGNSVYCLRNP